MLWVPGRGSWTREGITGTGVLGSRNSIPDFAFEGMRWTEVRVKSRTRGEMFVDDSELLIPFCAFKKVS